MNKPTAIEQGARLARWTEAFAKGRFQDFEGELEAGSTPNDVKRFLINSFGNRYAWLMREAASVAGAFEDFPALVTAYIRAVPYTRYDVTGPGDEERFLVWLTETQPLTPVQRDYVAFQRGEYAVGREGRRNRAAHVAFQTLRTQAEERAVRLEGESVRVHLNPIRFETELLTPTFAPGVERFPVRLLFFAAGTDAGAVLLDEAMAQVAQELTSRGPLAPEELTAGFTPPQREEFVRTLNDLAVQGVVAFEVVRE